MKKLLLEVLPAAAMLCLLFSGKPAAAAECTLLDDPLQVLDLHLEIEPADWEIIRRDLTYDIERPALFHCGTEDPIQVNVRRKESAALPSEDNPVKVSLKIDFDDRLPGYEWHGHRKISLENGQQYSELPGSLIKEGFSWHLMARAGVICGGFAWVRLHVNGQTIGMYTRVEQIDKRFLRRHLGEDDGFLYKLEYRPDQGTKKKQETRIGEFDPYDAALCFPPFDDKCTPPPPQEALAVLLQRVDLRQLLTIGAVNAILMNVDGLLEGDANYFWYNSEKPRRIFPWDLDLLLMSGDFNRDPHGSEVQRQLFALSPGLAQVYDRIILRILDELLDPASLDAYLDGLTQAIGPAVRADPLSGLTGGFDAEIKRLRIAIRERAKFLRQALGSLEPYPVVINEVLASNLETGGDENGEPDDWVELYNRSDSPAPLRGCFLTNDPAIPDRWPLPDLVLPPGGRLVIWCDGQPEQGVLHAPFKLEQDGEGLGLFDRVDGMPRVLDFLSFRPQDTDVSLGRFPDGATTFRSLPCPTPGAANLLDCPAHPVSFIRGDVKPDGIFNVSDAVQAMRALFQGQSLACWRTIDVDDDGQAGVSDVVLLLSFIYLGGKPPEAPFPSCGGDLTADDLPCYSHEQCF